MSCAPVCRRVVTVTKAQENFLYNLASYSEHNVHMYIGFLFFLHPYFTSLYNPYVPCVFLCGLFSFFYLSFPVCRLSASLSPSGSFCAKKKWSKHPDLRFDSLLEKKSIAIKNNRTVDLKSAHFRHIHTVKGKKKRER